MVRKRVLSPKKKSIPESKTLKTRVLKPKKDRLVEAENWYAIYLDESKHAEVRWKQAQGLAYSNLYREQCFMKSEHYWDCFIRELQNQKEAENPWAKKMLEALDGKNPNEAFIAVWEAYYDEFL